MKDRDHGNDQDEAALFEQAMGGVKRLHHKLTPPTPVRNAPMTASPSSVPEQQDYLPDFGEELRYLRPGIQASALQKLRRGQFPIESTLDLHGLTGAEASIRVQDFLQQAQQAGHSAVRIIHGKGYGSAGRQPVLKARVHQLLQEFASVLAFCSARPQAGGTGAVDVLLRKARMSR